MANTEELIQIPGCYHRRRQ